MADVITVGEKGQIVIPRKLREDLRIKKGTKLLVREERNRITMKPIALDEKHLFMLASEAALHKVWDNTYDEQWDEVL